MAKMYNFCMSGFVLWHTLLNKFLPFCYYYVDTYGQDMYVGITLTSVIL